MSSVYLCPCVNLCTKNRRRRMAIGSVVRPAGRQDRGEPTLGGTSSGNRRQDWQGEIDHGGQEELGSQRESFEPGTAGLRDPRLPWWIPDPAEGGVAVELQEAITQSILPAYQQLVLEAPSMMERVAGEMLIQALWADCLRQLKLKHNFAKAISDDPFESAGVVGEATALLGTKIKAGNFLVKVQEVRLKQEAAARNAMEATEKAMQEYRARFAGQAAARAGSAHRGEAPGMDRRAGTDGVGAEIEAHTAAVAEESRGVDQGRPAKAGTPAWRAVAEESKGVDQRRPAKAGTPTSAAVAEESKGVDHMPVQKEFRRADFSPPGRDKAHPTTPTSRAVAEESRGVDQARPAKAGTPTAGAVAEESRGVDQRRPAKAGTPTSRAVAEESRRDDQRRPAQAGTPTAAAFAEELRGVDQARTSASGKESLS